MMGGPFLEVTAIISVSGRATFEAAEAAFWAIRSVQLGLISSIFIIHSLSAQPLPYAYPDLA